MQLESHADLWIELTSCEADRNLHTSPHPQPLRNSSSSLPFAEATLASEWMVEWAVKYALKFINLKLSSARGDGSKRKSKRMGAASHPKKCKFKFIALTQTRSKQLLGCWPCWSWPVHGRKEHIIRAHCNMFIFNLPRKPSTRQATLDCLPLACLCVCRGASDGQRLGLDCETWGRENANIHPRPGVYLLSKTMCQYLDFLFLRWTRRFSSSELLHMWIHNDVLMIDRGGR